MDAQKTHDLVITRDIAAPVAQVWNAWVEPVLVKQWWGPDGFTCPLAEIDFREGGTSLVAMSSPQFGTNYSTWCYEEIVPQERIVYIHDLADETGRAIDPASIGMPPDFPRAQRQAVAFEPLDGGRTRVTVTEYGWTAGQMLELSRLGMEQCLAKMAAVLERNDTRI